MYHRTKFNRLNFVNFLVYKNLNNNNNTELTTDVLTYVVNGMRNSSEWLGSCSASF